MNIASWFRRNVLNQTKLHCIECGRPHWKGYPEVMAVKGYILCPPPAPCEQRFVEGYSKGLSPDQIPHHLPATLKIAILGYLERAETLKE